MTENFNWVYPSKQTLLKESPEKFKEFAYGVENSIQDIEDELDSLIRQVNFLSDVYKNWKDSSSIFISKMYIKNTINGEDIFFEIPNTINSKCGYTFYVNNKGVPEENLTIQWNFTCGNSTKSGTGNIFNIDPLDYSSDGTSADISVVVTDQDGNSNVVNKHFNIVSNEFFTESSFRFNNIPTYGEVSTLLIYLGNLENTFELVFEGRDGPLDVSYIEEKYKGEYEVKFNKNSVYYDILRIKVIIKSICTYIYNYDVKLSGESIDLEPSIKRINTNNLPQKMNKNSFFVNQFRNNVEYNYNLVDLNDLKVLSPKPTEVQYIDGYFLNEKAQLFKKIDSQGRVVQTELVGVDQLYFDGCFRIGETIYKINEELDVNGNIQINIFIEDVIYFKNYDIYSTENKTFIGDEEFNFSIEYYEIKEFPVLQPDGSVIIGTGEYIVINKQLYCRGYDFFTDFGKLNGSMETNFYENYLFTKSKSFIPVLKNIAIDDIKISYHLVWSNSNGVFYIGNNFNNINSTEFKYESNPQKIMDIITRKIFDDKSMICVLEKDSYNTYVYGNELDMQNLNNYQILFDSPVSSNFIKSLKSVIGWRHDIIGENIIFRNNTYYIDVISDSFTSILEKNGDLYQVDYENNINVYSFPYGEYKADIGEVTSSSIQSIESNFRLVNTSDIGPKFEDIEVTNKFAVAKAGIDFYIIGQADILANKDSESYENEEHTLWSKIELPQEIYNKIINKNIKIWGVCKTESDEFNENLYFVVDNILYYSGDIFFSPTKNYENGWKEFDLSSLVSNLGEIETVKLTEGASAISTETKLYLSPKRGIHYIEFGGLPGEFTSDMILSGKYWFEFDILGIDNYPGYDISSNVLCVRNSNGLFGGIGYNGLERYSEFKKIIKFSADSKLYASSYEIIAVGKLVYFITLPNGTIKFIGDSSLLNSSGEFTGLGDDGKTYTAVNETRLREIISNASNDANLNQYVTTLVTSMSYLFRSKDFNGDISSWDVSNVTNMNSMFNTSSFNQDISSWDVSSVTNMSGIFYFSQFNGDISSWDVSSVTDMSYMFYYSQFNQDISSWDVSSVTDMSYMFYYSPFNQDISSFSQFNQDISSWDVSSVTDMSYMFYYSSFNQDISSWDVSNVKYMSYMFGGSQFNGDISSWDVSSVTNMSGIFCFSQFNGDISSWDVSSVEYMDYMFGHSQFNGDISSWDVSSVIDMYSMFETSQFNQDISQWDVSNVEYMVYMFDHSQFNQDISSWDVSSVIDCSSFALQSPICRTSFMPNFTNCTSGC